MASERNDEILPYFFYIITMKKKKARRIFPADLTEFRNDGISYKSDTYYSNIADKIYWSIVKLTHEEDEDIARMCIRTALYFEDIVSHIGLWHSFRQNHLKMFGKLMPCEIGPDDRLEEDLSRGSVQFVLWLDLSDTYDLSVKNPNSEAMLKFSEVAFDILQQEFPKAEPNNELKSRLFSTSVFDDFHDIRKNLTWISFHSYLSIWHKVQSNAEKIYDTIFNVIDDEDAAEYAAATLSTFKYGCGPLAMKVSDVYADMLEFNGMAAEAKDVREIQYYDLNTWKLLQVKGSILSLEAPDGTKVFADTKTFPTISLEKLCSLPGIAAAFVKFRDTYEMIGMCTGASQKHLDDAIEDFKSKEQRKAIVAKFLEKNNSQRVHTFGTFESLAHWLKENFNAQLKKDSADMFYDDTDFTLYVPDSMDFEILAGYASAIRTESSDFFVDEYNEEAIMMFKDYDAVKDECLTYMVTNKMLPSARYKDSQEKERGLRVVQDNQEFLRRFYRRSL